MLNIAVTRSLSLSLIGLLLIRSPKREIITQQLHDERGILVGVLRDVVELSNSILEGGAGHLAGLIGILEHFVLKDGVVEDEAKADRVRDGQVLLGNLLCGFVRLPGTLGGLALLVALAELGDVTVVVGLHLLVENLGLSGGRLGDEVILQKLQDGATDLR